MQENRNTERHNKRLANLVFIGHVHDGEQKPLTILTEGY